MFCPKCGTENPENGKFCRSCGTDLLPVSDALAGKSNNQTPDFWMMSPRQMRSRQMQMFDKKGKPVSWESAMGKLFTGLAFLAVTIALAFSQAGHGWWFWMLIPAFSMIGNAVAKIIQLKKTPSNNFSVSPAETAKNIASGANNALPQSQTDYISPAVESRYKTGDLVPPSVVEGTTRHLEINKEGETMTLPKK